MLKLLAIDCTEEMNEECWVIQCLDRDLAAQGSTLMDALNSFNTLYKIDTEHCEPLRSEPLQPTPKPYWDWFDGARPPLEVSLPNLGTCELRLVRGKHRPFSWDDV